MVLVAISVLLIWLYAFRPLFSVDLFWHLETGEVIARTGSIPTTDMFSAVHPESPWVQFQWLWELLAALVTDAFGLTGLRAAQATTLAATFLAFWAIVRRELRSAGAAAFLTALLLVLFEDRFQVRPDVFNLVLLLPVVPLLLGGFRERLRSGRRRTFVVVALCGFVWANMHSGGSLLLIASLGALATGVTLNRWWRLGPAAPPEAASEPVRATFLLLAVTTIPMLLTPAFVRGLIHFAHIFGPALAIGNPEWDPSYSMLSHGMHPDFLVVGLGPYVVALAYVVSTTVRVRRHGRSAVDLAELLLLLGYLFIAHHWVRSAYLAVVPLAAMLRRAPLGRRTVQAGLVTAALALMAVTYDYNILRPRGSLTHALEMASLDLEPTAFPEQAADFMEEAGIEGRAMNEGRWGGYLIWRLWPAVHVFVDTRHNLDEAMWRMFVATHHPFRRAEALDEAAATHGTDLAIFRSPTFPLYVPPPHWVLLYRAGDQEVLTRADTDNGRENIRRAAAWYGARGVPIPEPAERHPAALMSAALRVGGQDWLEAPYQRMRLLDARNDIASGEPDRVTRGKRREGLIFFQAAWYEPALEALAPLAAIPDADPKVLYAVAFSAALTGDGELARAILRRMSQMDLGALSVPNRERARRLLEALSGS